MVPRARADFRARAELLLKFLMDVPLEFAISTSETLVVVRGLVAVSLMTFLELEILRRLLVDIVWHQ